MACMCFVGQRVGVRQVGGKATLETSENTLRSIAGIYDILMLGLHIAFAQRPTEGVCVSVTAFMSGRVCSQSATGDIGA